jgi:hypothetical protein
MQPNQSGWSKIVEAVDKPLGFYVLALLIIEGFLALVLTVSGLEQPAQERGMWAGVGLFVFVVSLVTLCVWKKPTHLTFIERGSLTEMGRITYGTGEPEIPEDNSPRTQNGGMPPQRIPLVKLELKIV